jgi:hypothetical protein
MSMKCCAGSFCPPLSTLGECVDRCAPHVSRFSHKVPAMRVLVADEFSTEHIAQLQALGLDVDYNPQCTAEDLVLSQNWIAFDRSRRRARFARPQAAIVRGP